MPKIGILSDTHGSLPGTIDQFFSSCKEIWHAGDIGNPEIIDTLEKIAPVRAVYGNIDGHEVRAYTPAVQHFEYEELNIAMTHIAGYPGRYDKHTEKWIQEIQPDIFICGHSHILKVIYDKKLQHLHINPGAAGKNGFHKVRTAIRVDLVQKEIKNLEILEIQRGQSNPNHS